MELVVYDTNIIIDLYDMGLLPTVRRYGWQIHTTDMVLGELLRPRKEEVLNFLPELCVYRYDGYDKFEKLINFINDLPQKGNLSMTDGSVLLLSKELNAILCSNDVKLRDVAKSEGLVVKGSLGILLMLVDAKLINVEDALLALDKLVEANDRLSEELVGEVRRRIFA